jgi:hypothetical protein
MRIAHQEIGGGYAMGPKVIVDTCQFEDGMFETIAMDEAGMDFDCKRTMDKGQALRDFNEILMKHAGPIQKTVLSAGMEAGKKYTIFKFSEFGQPVAYKFTFVGGIECTTYAQYRDVVKFTVIPARKRGARCITIHSGSFAIAEGWQDIPDGVKWNKVEGHDGLVVSKYGCFDPRYFEDMKKVVKNVLSVYERVDVGVNGRAYA